MRAFVLKYAHISLQTRLMHDLVYEVSCDAWFRLPRSNVQHLTRQPAHLTHALYLLRIEYRNLVAPNEDLL
jgi:hypothetical protein